MNLYRSLPLLLLPRPQLFPLLRRPIARRSTPMTHQSSPSPTPPPTKRRCLHTSTPPTMSTTAPRIELTPTEETVRRLLLDVSAEIDTYNRTTGARNKDPVLLRFTGGWVRDKLLGIPSHDIDVGISRMTGYNFGLYLADFLQRHYDSYGIEPGAVHRIESNPEKSKHLETATMKILGLDIDLVNLRSEVYKGDSRVPIMEFGTPEQDALRRDCTVNALFYNLHTRRVEDFTQHGLEDMRNKIIRTPLPPHETFDDDPLRILRLIRFSSRLGFEIVPEAKEAMRLPDINDALRHKISRERIGDELHKMFVGPSPDTSLTLIHQNSLYKTIFAPPDLTPLPELPLSILPRALAATRHLHTLPSHKPLVPTQHDTYLTWLLAALSPWQDIVLPAAAGNKKAPPPADNANSKKKAPPPADNKKAPPPAAAVAAREGLKLINRTTDIVARAFRFLPAVRAMVAAAEDARGPARVGMFVKELGASWRSSLWASEMLELAKAWPEDGGDTPSSECVEIISRYEALTARIVELGMEEAYLVKPLIDGNELVAIVGRPRGPWVSKALPRIIEWQWANPGAGKEQALEWVKAQRGAL